MYVCMYVCMYISVNNMIIQWISFLCKATVAHDQALKKTAE